MGFERGEVKNAGVRRSGLGGVPGGSASRESRGEGGERESAYVHLPMTWIACGFHIACHAKWLNKARLAIHLHIPLITMAKESSKRILINAQRRYGDSVQIHPIEELWKPRRLIEKAVVLDMETARILINSSGYMKNGFQLSALLEKERKAQGDMITPAILEKSLLAECAHRSAAVPQIVYDYIQNYARFHACVEKQLA